VGNCLLLTPATLANTARSDKETFYSRRPGLFCKQPAITAGPVMHHE